MVREYPREERGAETVSAGKPIISLKRFEKCFGEVRAVHPLDLEIVEGESFALLGPNGGGKTTIIRALVGLHAPSAGQILIDGHDIVREPDAVRNLISYVPQRVGMPGLLTGREVVAFFAQLKGAPDTRIDEVLDLFALTESADRFTREFSGGMMQRLGLAVAFLQDVPLFIFDEPTLNLDAPGIECLQNLLKEKKHNGTTVVFASHSLHYAMQLADRVALLVEGRMVRVEEVPVFRDMITREMRVHVVLDHSSDEMVEAARSAGAESIDRNGKQLWFRAIPEKRLDVVRAIEGAGGGIKEIHTETPDWDVLIRDYLNSQDSLNSEEVNG